jgi:hypothetical protein
VKEIDDFFAEQDRRNAEGTLTVGDAMIGCYYRLLEGNQASRVIIKIHHKIDDEPVFEFANGLTWGYVNKYKDVRCERTYPTFSPPQHAIDYSQAQWYNDDGSGPCHHSW